MSFFKKDKNTEDVSSLLKEIRDKIPSREEQIFQAVLSGVLSRHGAFDSEGNPALAWVEKAREFAKGVK